MSDNNGVDRTGRYVVYLLSAHIVLVTKYRRGAITDRVRNLLLDVTREVCDRHGVTIFEADCEHDHLHLLLNYSSTVALCRLVGSIKTNTSSRVRQQGWPEITQALWGDHFWYFVTSTGGAPLVLVSAYVCNQRKPNKNLVGRRANPALTDRACTRNEGSILTPSPCTRPFFVENKVAETGGHRVGKVGMTSVSHPAPTRHRPRLVRERFG